MGWEARGHSLYLYRKTRRGQRVISEYLGGGQIAELIYELDTLDNLQRKSERDEWKESMSEIQTVECEIERLAGIARGLVMAFLLVSGYHPHKGQWRKSRNG